MRQLDARYLLLPAAIVAGVAMADATNRDADPDAPASAAEPDRRTEAHPVMTASGIYPSTSALWTRDAGGTTVIDPTTGQAVPMPRGRLRAMRGIDGAIVARVDVEAGPAGGGKPIGACCQFIEEICTPDLEFCACNEIGGNWFEGLTCDDIACPELFSCCFPIIEMCVDDVGIFECFSGGGLIAIEGLTCAELECPPPPMLGACCLFDGFNFMCEENVDLFQCAVSGGFGQPDAVCADIGCPPLPPVGACCVEADAACSIVDVDACLALGGEFLFQPTCEGVSCPTLGACCIIRTGRCRARATEAQCAANDGLWFAERTCAEIDCPDRRCGVLNPSFETGDFQAWIAQDIASPAVLLQVVDALTAMPTDGDHAVVHGFDGGAAGSIILAQDVYVPSSIAALTFDYHAGWDLFSFCATSSRSFEVSIRPEGGGDPLREPEVILVAEAGTIVDTGPQVGSVDVRDFHGQVVRLQFEWIITEPFSGPAFFELDNISCELLPDDDGDDDDDDESSDSESSDSDSRSGPRGSRR